MALMTSYDPGARKNYKDTSERIRQALWARMDKCHWCEALPGMPCRDKTSPGRVFIMTRPHRGRAARPAES